MYVHEVGGPAYDDGGAAPWAVASCVTEPETRPYDSLDEDHLGSGLELLDEETCWRHLAACEEGILHYRSGRGATSVAVAYDVTGRDVAISILPTHTASQYVEGAELMIEITRLTSGHDRRVVRVTGRGERIRWPTAGSYGTFRLAGARIRGFLQTSGAAP